MSGRAALLLAVAWLAAAAAPARAEPTPAERRIAAARAAIDAHPERAEGWTTLAFASARRARETADPAFYDRAERALARAGALAPGDLEVEKTRVWVLLGRHEFARARDAARALQRRAPGDPVVHGLLADAQVELGEYEAAERTVQALLDLQPGNVAGLTRAAHLRELFGDLAGARALMEDAYERLPARETEDRAWVATHVAHLLRLEGRLDEAERAVAHALALFPGYHYALGELGRVRTAQDRHAEAIEALRERHAAAPHPENLYELASALARVGRTEQAAAAWRRFEAEARAESESADNCNRELVLYTVDVARRPVEALRIAERERGRRGDLLTRDALAWALLASGQAERARAELAPVLALGVRDPVVLAHARAIEARLGAARAEAGVEADTRLR